jgi:DNA polymerase III, delta subunit
VKSDDVLAALAGGLPPALLVRGPGAWELASSAAQPGWHVTEKLDAAASREIRRTAWLRPNGAQRVYLVCLDGAALPAQNSLLKVLEEPPATTRFVLASAGLVLPTVTSRCRVLALSGRAEDPAFADPRVRSSVAAAVDSARQGQHARLHATVRNWWKEAAPGQQPPQLRLLAVWAAEAASQRWALFAPSFAPGVAPSEAMQLLAELARLPGARLAPQVALARVFCA